MSLSRDIEKHLKKQAKLNQESEKIIDSFLKLYPKKEVYSVMGYVESAEIPKHIETIKKFIKCYEDNTLSVKDIKSYLTVFKLYKDLMKESNQNLISSKNSMEEKDD